RHVQSQAGSAVQRADRPGWGGRDDPRGVLGRRRDRHGSRRTSAPRRPDPEQMSAPRAVVRSSLIALLFMPAAAAVAETPAPVEPAAPAPATASLVPVSITATMTAGLHTNDD